MFRPSPKATQNALSQSNIDAMAVEQVEQETNDLTDDLLSDSESGKLMAEINATKAVESKKKKKEKKTKSKDKPRQKKTYSAVIISTVLGILCGGVGFLGGYFLYTATKPETQYDADASDLRSLESRAEGSKDLLKTFENDKYNIVNLAMVRFAKREQSMILSKNIAINFSGRQHVWSAVINNEDRTFSQCISTTEEDSFIKLSTAFRFYDEHDEVIKAFEFDFPEQWTPDAIPTKTYTYDEYLDTYGKLNQGLYIIDEEKNYVTSDYTVEEGELISGVNILQITEKSVKDLQITELDDGKYQFDFTLYSNRACFYSSKNVKANGKLQKNPKFQETVNVQFVLDENFDLYSSSSAQGYTVTMGVEVDVVTTSQDRYFWSDTDQFVVDNKDVNIPVMGEQFNLYINDEGNFVERAGL